MYLYVSATYDAWFLKHMQYVTHDLTIPHVLQVSRAQAAWRPSALLPACHLSPCLPGTAPQGLPGAASTSGLHPAECSSAAQPLALCAAGRPASAVSGALPAGLPMLMQVVVT